MSDTGFCEWCGSSFEVARTNNPKPKRYCSHNCRTNGYRKSVRIKQFAERSTTCLECGVEFEQNPVGAPRKYCSDLCKNRVGNRAARRRLKPLAEATTRRCAHCGDEFVATNRARIYCPDKWCAQLAYRERQKADSDRRVVERSVACDGCGSQFTAKHPSARWCSRYCANKYWGLVRSRRRGEAPGTIPYIDRQVFERDNWTCHICGLPVDPGLDRLDPMGATIDHILPLSRGGADDLSNVATAHWSCNRNKRAN